MGRLDYWATCACCSPAALRETPPAPPVTLLRYPAVNTLKILKVKEFKSLICPLGVCGVTFKNVQFLIRFFLFYRPSHQWWF